MRGKTILLLLVLAGFAIAGNQALQKIAELEAKVSGLQELVAGLTSNVATFADGKEELLQQKYAMLQGNPELREALRLWEAMPEVCSKLPFAAIISTGDQGCMKAVDAAQHKRLFPSQGLMVSIMRDPVAALAGARQFFAERCNLLPTGVERPDVCT